ncbi:predicted protein [Nematostella vectensis]|uniref:Uncharacterized protein n=1 Tax=Nematostella vectensis TaxID=45351 RepID=A7T6Q3_NEMVE|nr:predicted protein [Nematostella vectensis]|eukprot:XP_001620452.1 hypothetical protein NEMVEDRAFT_v1g223098 [Nematostella vectensis]
MTSKLVPQKSNNLFGTEQWNKLMKEVSRPYEWHSEYEILCDLMHKYVKLNDRLLRLACGDSKLGENLYDVGYRNIISVDSSEKVIKKMRKRNDSGKRDMEYTRMDVTDPEFSLWLGQQSPFKVLELCIDDSDTIQRVQAIGKMKEAIVVKQRYALIRDMIALKFHPGENFTFDFWSTDPQMKEPRFSLTVVDSEQHRNQNGIFAIFIVPQGGDIGIRKTVHEGSSSLSGDYIVEDITIGEDTFRRLVFLINPHGIQSEAKLFTAKDGKKKAGHIDFSFLTHSHHKAMVAGLALVDKLLEKEKKKQALIVGLGGGGLAMFIYQFFSQVAIDAVELDEAVVSVAKTQFGCIEDKRLAIHVKDGLKFIEESHIKVPRPQYHAIMFDIDSKDVTVGMSAPSKDFVTPALLTRVKELLHNEGGQLKDIITRFRKLDPLIHHILLSLA